MQKNASAEFCFERFILVAALTLSLNMLCLSTQSAHAMGKKPPKEEPVQPDVGTVFKPKKNTTEVLYGNPYMGWVLEYNTIEGLPYINNHVCRDMGPQGRFYPEFDTIEIFSSWGDIERKEGVFDWSRLDSAINLWVSKGKKIRLRVSTDDLGPYFTSIPQDRMGTPEWVYSLYGVEKDTKAYDGAQGWQFPNVSNPKYQEKVSAFLQAYAKRYRNHESIEIVSLRGFGAWAEWHDGYTFKNLDQKATALRQIIDLWMKAWDGSGKLLSLSISIDCDGADWNSAACNDRKSKDYNGFKYRLGYDHALNIPMLTFNKDCVGACTAPNEYSLLKEAFDSKKLPLIGEFGGFYSDYKKSSNGRTFDFAQKDVFAQRLNFITALGWSCDLHDADDFYQEQKGIINSVMLQLGYRLSISQITLPKVLDSGAAFTMKQSWRNDGVGRFYGAITLKAYLVDSIGNVIWDGVDPNIDLTNCLKENKDLQLSSSFVLPVNINSGTYDLRVALVDSVTGKPKVKLAMDGADSQGRYSLGSITVQKSGSTFYGWRVDSFSACSAVCGGGTQTRSVVCVDPGGQSVAESFCPNPKPEVTQSCNIHACSPNSGTPVPGSCTTSDCLAKRKMDIFLIIDSYLKD